MKKKPKRNAEPPMTLNEAYAHYGDWLIMCAQQQGGKELPDVYHDPFSPVMHEIGWQGVSRADHRENRCFMGIKTIQRALPVVVSCRT